MLKTKSTYFKTTMHWASDVSFIGILTFNSHRVLWPTLNSAVESAVQKGKLTGLRIAIQHAASPASGTSEVKAKCSPWYKKAHWMPLPHLVSICLIPNLL